jgi:3-hydroxyisobutyrate dehydrogenase-like beta-hydroxyacid dehydrogenase
MGLPIGHRLLAAGHELTVMDRDAAPVRTLVEADATAAATPREAAAATQLTFVSLPRPEIVESVVLAQAGVIACAAAGSTVVDLSTGSPALARRMFEAGRLRGVDILDAPISGAPLGARASTLAIMVGGEPDAFRRVQPVLEAFGATIRHMRAAGAGQVTKLANNMLAAAQMAALAEAVAFA